VLDEEVHVDGKIADRLFQPGRVLFTSFESLTAEFPTEVAILARVRGEGNAEIDIECGRTRQRAILSVVATEVFRDQSADEHKIGAP